MIGALSFLTSKLGRYLALAGALLLAVVTFGASQRAKGRRGAENDAMKDSAKRQEKGREAVQDISDASRDELDRRLRDNDGIW